MLGQLRSEARPLMLQGFELGTLLGLPFGGRLLEGGIVPGLGLVWRPCMNQSRGLRSQYTRSFSIIGVPRP